MRKLGEQWVEEIGGKEHMLKCIGLADDMSIIIKDLGVLNDDGCLAEERTGKFPNISFSCDEWCIEYNEDYISVACFGVTKQEAIDAWNRRN